MTSVIDNALLAPAGTPTKLPALPAPSPSIEFLRALKEILEVMLGRRGNEWDRVVTFRDLAGLNLAPGQFAGAGTGQAIGDGVVLPVGAGEQIITQLERELRESAAYKSLVARIGSAEDLAMFPEEFRAALARSIAATDQALGATIRDVDTKVQRAEMAMATRLTEITAVVEGSAAGVRRFDAAYADRNRALATSITQVAARLDDVGGVTLEERFVAIADSVDGLQGQWTVKLQTDPVNGGIPVIAGIGLSVEQPVAGPGTSAMVFMAEKFGFFTNNGTVMPFGIANGNVFVNGTLRINDGTGRTLGDISSGTVTFVGEFSTVPAVTPYRANDIYRNTTDGNTYILKVSGTTKSWAIWLAKGTNGVDGTDGRNGSNGARGSVDIAVSGYSSWPTNATTVFTSAYGLSPVNRDRLTVYSGTFSQTRFYDNGSWLTLSAWINGNMVVDGTFSASKISAGTLRSISMNIANGDFVVTESSIIIWNPTLSAATCSNAANPGGPALNVLAGSGSQTTALTVSNRGTGMGVSSSGSSGQYAFYATSGGYGPFTGAHDGLVPNGADIDVGDLVLDVDLVATNGYSDALFAMERSSAPYQRGVRGPVAAVIGPLRDHAPAAMVQGRSYHDLEDGKSEEQQVMHGSYYELGDTHTLVVVNSVGEGQIKVCGEGGPIGPDDLLVTSSIPGVAMRQNVGKAADGEADDLIRSFTVAKARVGKGQAIKFTNSNEVRVIPCIYLGG